MIAHTLLIDFSYVEDLERRVNAFGKDIAGTSCLPASQQQQRQQLSPYLGYDEHNLIDHASDESISRTFQAT
jgi:hypothetical protein